MAEQVEAAEREATLVQAEVRTTNPVVELLDLIPVLVVVVAEVLAQKPTVLTQVLAVALVFLVKVPMGLLMVERVVEGVVAAMGAEVAL